MGPLPRTLSSIYRQHDCPGVMARCFEVKCIVMSRLSAERFSLHDLIWTGTCRDRNCNVKAPVFWKAFIVSSLGPKDEKFSIRIVSLYSAGLSLPLTIKISLVSLSFSLTNQVPW